MSYVSGSHVRNGTCCLKRQIILKRPIYFPSHKIYLFPLYTSVSLLSGTLLLNQVFQHFPTPHPKDCSPTFIFYPHSHLAPGNRLSTFCFYKFAFSGHFIEPESYNMRALVSAFFHLALDFRGPFVSSECQ